MNPHDLIEVARALAEPDDAPPTQAGLGRAISTAYYAMFHCLAMSAADLFIGAACSPAWHRSAPADTRSWPCRVPAHGRPCRSFQWSPRLRRGVRRIAEGAAGGGLRAGHRRLTEEVRRSGPHRVGEALSRERDGPALRMKELAIRQFGRASVDARRNLVAHVLFRQRPPSGG